MVTVCAVHGDTKQDNQQCC